MAQKKIQLASGLILVTDDWANNSTPNDGRIRMGRDGLGIRAAQDRLVAIEEITQRQIFHWGEPEPALDRERKYILRFLIDEEEMI